MKRVNAISSSGVPNGGVSLADVGYCKKAEHILVVNLWKDLIKHRQHALEKQIDRT